MVASPLDRLRVGLALLLVLATSLVAAGAASAGGGGGGLALAGKPRLADATCLSRCVATRKATPGAMVRLTGSYLEGARKVVFQGAGGSLPVSYVERASGSVSARVPVGATSGRPYVLGEGGVASNPSPQTLEILPPGALPERAYPVRGAHEYWDGFGAGRGHEGVDIGSPCGTPLVAVGAGRITFVKYHASAGNYVVIDLTGTTTDVAYMHLIRPASVRPGQRVTAGQQIGNVGETGNASGCHLHFEVWEGAYYGGGSAIDPMPFLKGLERERRGHRPV